MSLNDNTYRHIDNLISNYELEEIFEMFDLEVDQVMEILIQNGLIDLDLLEEVSGN